MRPDNSTNEFTEDATENYLKTQYEAMTDGTYDMSKYQQYAQLDTYSIGITDATIRQSIEEASPCPSSLWLDPNADIFAAIKAIIPTSPVTVDGKTYKFIGWTFPYVTFEFNGTEDPIFHLSYRDFYGVLNTTIAGQSNTYTMPIHQNMIFIAKWVEETE